MKTLACGTKQLKTVIAKENLKKPKQTQKKTSEQIVFVGLLVWYFLESQNLTVTRGIFKILIDGGKNTMMTDMSYPVESSKRRKRLDDSSGSGTMTVTTG